MIRLINKIKYFNSIRERIKLERETRLGKAGMNDILPITTNQSLQKIRNIGIIAHIDAGKTTTTERMLYYAGALPSPGQIDEGNTTMDYMPQQRQRGITIRSAAISFNWNKYQINLIDTPGHVDFSAEVIRSLQVLDGAVTILDAVKGVQAQTIKVWQQASKRNLPKICFLNKMDRIGSSMGRSAQTIKQKLKVEPLFMQMPIGDGDTFKGIVDLITLQKIHFNGYYGQELQYTPITKKDPKYNFYNDHRQTLIQKIGSFDQQIGDMYLNDKPIGANLLKTALRRIMTGQAHVNSVCPVFLGSAYKNKGLQPVLDAVIDYFPSPSQKKPVQNMNDLNDFRKPINSEKLTGFVFKTIYDLEKGLLAYTRIYSGILSKSMELMNSSSNTPQKASQIYRVRANQYVPINQVGAGDIVAIAGLAATRAGHTLLSLKDSNFNLESMQMPSPVFVAPFQVQSSKYVRNFEQAMNKIVVQDNSISWNFQKQTSQFLVSGLGELHLQIIQDKLIESGIPVKMGFLKINYKQSIKAPITKKHKILRKAKQNTEQQFEIQVQLVPIFSEEQILANNNKVVLAFENESELFEQYWKEYQLRKTGQIKSRSKQNFDTAQEMQKSKEVTLTISKKFLKNPNPVEPIVEGQQNQGDQQEQQQVDQQSQDEDKFMQNRGQQESFYHISTLPFETLYELVENCKVSLLYGKHNLPLMGVEVKIIDGKYRKEAFTKPVMNQCAQRAIRQCLQEVCVLLQPIMQVDLQGQPEMVELIVKQIIKKRGRVEQRDQNNLKCFVPADGVRGWVKQLRSMGFEVSMKLSGYEEVQGINPAKLLEENS